VLPDDSEFAENGDISRPGGVNIAVALCELLADEGLFLHSPVQHSFYGWAFATKPDGDLGFVLQFAGPWILECIDQGKMPSRQQQEVVQTLHRVLVSDARFSNLRWYKRADYLENGQWAHGPV
jgi:hypothetical protein